ncbi:Transposon TX1 uncharacterized protein [Chionoecetes opilio]|uniref:Transposon TX1 uncharacterized protein n=1 Tax=Chionoecetes opilio TaxID=41210 RepID=A0A8J4YXN8_CHIOP|nr:Transposon TX1 uncharacterized protein [Chionoecetes opilio]
MVYAPTEMRKTEEKEMFYAKLDSVLDQCPPRDTLIVLGDFNATTGTVQKVANCRFLVSETRAAPLDMVYCSNAGGVAKEIDHILVCTRWRILQNCRVYRSAEFFGTDHRLVVATLKLHVKSRRISRGNHTVFHHEKLKDLTCAHEYAVAVSNRFDVLGALGDPVELWDTFKRETLQAAKECIGERPRSRRGFVSTETLEKIEESRAARLAGNRDQHRALSRRTRTLLGRDKERYVRSLAEDVEGHLNANDLRPAYRALKNLRSKSPSRASAIRTADGRLMSDMDGQMARWAEYFGQLFTVDPPTEQLHTTGLQAVDADPPIDESAPSLDEVREAVAKLKGGKAAGVCNISAELLKAGGEAMIHGLHAVLTAVRQSGTIPPAWKRGLVVPIWKGKGDRQDCNNYRGITLLSVPGKVLAHLLLTRIRSHLVKHQRPQQSGFTPGKSTTDRILALRALVERRLIFAESLEVLVMALEALHEETKPLGLEVSWLKTKVQVFGDLLDEAVQNANYAGLRRHLEGINKGCGIAEKKCSKVREVTAGKVNYERLGRHLEGIIGGGGGYRTPMGVYIAGGLPTRDGQALVQAIGKPTGAKSFGDLANVFNASVFSHFNEHCSRIDVVFDRYRITSIKSGTRERRDGRVRSIRRKTDSRKIPLPANWKQFMDLPENKANLTKFLSDQMMLEAKKSRPTCELITAGGFEEDTKVASSQGSDVEQLQPSHDEADTRIILHAKAAYMDGYEWIIVSCRDTDVLVLLTYFAGQLSGELWMGTGTRQERRYVAVHDIQLTQTMQRNILVYHAVTGCDTVSQPHGHEKKTTWKVFQQHGALLDDLGRGTLSESTIRSVEEFFCRIYSPASDETNINDVRYRMFQKGT